MSYEYPNPREDLIFQAPWAFLASDDELAARGMLEDHADEYLYVKITGEVLEKIEWTPYVYLAQSGEFRRIGRGDGNMAHLDKSLWNRSMYASVYVGEKQIKDVIEGSQLARFYLDTSVGPYATKYSVKPRADWHKLSVKSLEVFVLQREGDSYRTLNVSDLFRCHGADMAAFCFRRKP